MGIINADELAKSYKLSLLKKIKAGDLHDDDLFQISSIRTNPKYFDTNAIDLDEFTKYIALKIGEHTGVEVTPYHDSGDKIATIAINGVPIDIYANDIEDVIDKNVSGSIVSFDDAAEAPLVKCVVDITAQQAGEGDPSPTNVRPITGFSEVDVTRCAKNLLNYNAINPIIYNAQGSKRWGWEFNTPGTYTISAIPQSAYVFAKKVNADGTYGEGVYVAIPDAGTATNNPYTVTISEGERLLIYSAVSGSESKSNAIYNVNQSRPQLEVGSVATSYESYNGNTYEIAMPAAEGTVYGGTLDVLTGKLTVTHKAVDMGDLDYNYISNENRFYTTGLANVIKHNEGALTLLSSIFRADASLAYLETHDNCMWLSAAGNISFSANGYTNSSEFKTAVTGQKLVYELTTPIEYDLTPQQISTLLGTNNIWANSGDIDVTYFLKGSQPIIDLINKSSCLPVVSTSDEGKVLTVNSSGQWVAADLPDGSNTEY